MIRLRRAKRKNFRSQSRKEIGAEAYGDHVDMMLAHLPNFYQVLTMPMNVGSHPDPNVRTIALLCLWRLSQPPTVPPDAVPSTPPVLTPGLPNENVVGAAKVDVLDKINSILAHSPSATNAIVNWRDEASGNGIISQLSIAIGPALPPPIRYKALAIFLNLFTVSEADARKILETGRTQTGTVPALHGGEPIPVYSMPVLKVVLNLFKAPR